MIEYIVNPEEEHNLFYGRKYEELIRCKDCKHYYEKEWLVGGGLYIACWNNSIANAKENDYCSSAERKQNDKQGIYGETAV